MLCALFAGVFRYVDDHFHTPETFVENTSELADNADIRERLFEGFRSEIIALADGDVDEIEDSTGGLLGSGDDNDDDDDTVDPVLDPVTQQRIERDLAIEEILLDVFDSELYNQTFTAALQRTQVELIASADLESAALLRNKGDVTFDMRSLYQTLWLRFQENPLTVEITQNSVPDHYGIFKVADRETTANFLWTLLRNGPSWRGLTMAGAVLCLIGSVVIAERRPSTAIQFGGGMVGVGVVLVVIVYLIRFVVPLLAGGGSGASPVVATYATNTAPLVGNMIRLIIFGAILAAVGGIAKLIWPDDWLYSSVSDDRGVRSIMRRRGAGEPEPQVQQPAAAAPVGYATYPPQGYPGYPPQWGQPYPPHYPPGYAAPYPAGPYAQPAAPLPQRYDGPGKPTVPVMPVQVGGGDDLVPPAPPPLDAAPGDRPADAAQAVPKVVATTDTTLDAGAESASNSAKPAAKATVVEPGDADSGDDDDPPESSQELIDEAKAAHNDDWSGEKDW